MSTQTVTIKSLGAQGDGIAHCPDGPVYVPFALPGETVAIAKVKDHGTVMSITEASPERRAPACRHFGPEGKNGTCGGCSLQHLADEPYHAYKRELVVSALKSKGLTPDVDNLVICRPGERRRAVFAARKTEKGLLLGFSQANSHHIVAIEECPVTSPGIVSRLDAIRAIGLSMVANAEPFRMTVLETLSGLDISVDGIKSVSDKQRRTLTETVLAMRGIARVSLSGEILIEPQKPIIEFGGVAVSPPAGSFTQATKQAEDTMAKLVQGACGGGGRQAAEGAGFRRPQHAGPEAGQRREARSLPPSPDDKRAQELRRRRLRSATRGRGIPVQGTGTQHGKEDRGRELQPADTGARSRHPDRGRLSHHPRHAGRPVPVVAACGSRGDAGEISNPGGEPLSDAEATQRFICPQSQQPSFLCLSQE